MVKHLNFLVAEHDKEFALITKKFLASCGYTSQICLNGEEALLQFNKGLFDFVLVNVNITVNSGIDLVKKIRNKHRFIPIIVMGKQQPQSVIIDTFEAGADDYLHLPIIMEELGMRINAICRRVKSIENQQHIYTFGGFTLDTLHNVLIYKGVEQKATSREMNLLYLFVVNKNRVVERSTALKRIWNRENFFCARNMDVYVKRLRKLLCVNPNVKIVNVHGVGYKLIIETE